MSTACRATRTLRSNGAVFRSQRPSLEVRLADLQNSGRPARMLGLLAKTGESLQAQAARHDESFGDVSGAHRCAP